MCHRRMGAGHTAGLKQSEDGIEPKGHSARCEIPVVAEAGDGGQGAGSRSYRAW